MNLPENKSLILIVDDSAANLQVLDAMLAGRYQVRSAMDGKTALSLAVQEPQPQLILLDRMMPGMDGTEVLRCLRANQKTADIPVIFVTADTNTQSQVDCFERGAEDFLTKPVVEAILIARVQSVLRRVELEKETLRLTKEAAERDLTATKEQLEDARELLLRSGKLDLLGKLVATFAHDIGGPIGNCITTTSTLRESVQSLRKDIDANALKRSTLLDFVTRADRGIELGLKNLERAHLLLDTLRQQSQDQATSQTRKISLKSWMEGVLLTISPLLTDGGHQCLLAIPPDLELETQPGPLSQVVVNLVNNAVVHAFEGRTGGTIRIGVRLLAGGRIEMMVEDDGCGISSEIQSRIFEPFFTTKQGRGGTGLGLDIVRHTVEDILNGTLSVASTPGIGTRFKVELSADIGEKPAQNR